MKEFNTGAVREDKTGKGRCDLLPMCSLIRLSKHYEAGTEAHGERNWEKGLPMHSFIDSALRHLFKYVDGQTDEDHLCAAAWNILGAMWTEEKKPEMQDIPTRPNYDRTIDHSCAAINMCNMYHDGRCWGTKDRDSVSCNGDWNKCSEKPTYADVHDIVEE